MYLADGTPRGCLDERDLILCPLESIRHRRCVLRRMLWNRSENGRRSGGDSVRRGFDEAALAIHRAFVGSPAHRERAALDPKARQELRLRLKRSSQLVHGSDHRFQQVLLQQKNSSSLHGNNSALLQ